jgi:hypothetical protein
MGNSKAKETFDIVMPDSILNQSAVLPQRARRTTENVERKSNA